MTFDEQLAHALESLTGRLQDEVSRQVRVAADDLARLVESELASARSETDAVRTELETARGELESAHGQVETTRGELDAARAEQPRLERDASTGPLAAQIRTLDAARSLGEVLDALVGCASEQSPRAGVLTVRAGRFQEWRLAGFALPAGNGPLDLSPSDAGIIAEAARRSMVMIGPAADRATDDGAQPPSFAHLPADRDYFAAPLIVGGHAVAVLYADTGEANAEPESERRESGGRSEGVSPWSPEPLEILSLHASRCLEALTAMKAARALALPMGDTSTSSLTGEPSADEFASARRYARLLVSEIKLYHEAQVVAGCRERDLATRLGGEIARVRALYEQRVPPSVRRNTNYVHEELVRTLADGDATLLELGT